MKFKTIFILFNAVIVAAFLFIFLLPLTLLGPEYFRMFIQKNWIAAVLFLLTLIIINGYFFYNRKLFHLLEREDWPELIRLLEDSIYRKGRLRRTACRMLLNAYLITANTGPIAALEARVRRDRPALLKPLALLFGLPYLLRNEPEAAESYFGPLAAEAGVADRGWIRWNYAFSLMQQKKYDRARGELLGLLQNRPESVLRLLTLYLLNSYEQAHPEVREPIERGREELARRWSAEQWRHKLENPGGNPQVSLLAPILREAQEWLFSPRVVAGKS
jgi:hypothetical protein